MYSDFEWSAAIDFGAQPKSLWKVNWTSMASTREGKAMVVWQTDDGILGRWIERIH